MKTMNINSDGEITYGVFLRTGHNYDTDAASNETGLNCPADESKTQQQFKEESDINEIVRRFGLTGELPDDYQAPQTGDFTGVVDFQTAMTAVRQAEEAFMELPAELRARFHNDPQELMTFLDFEDNRAEALKLGLIQKPPEKTRDMINAIDELRDTIKPPQPKEK